MISGNLVSGNLFTSEGSLQLTQIWRNGRKGLLKEDVVREEDGAKRKGMLEPKSVFLGLRKHQVDKRTLS